MYLEKCFLDKGSFFQSKIIQPTHSTFISYRNQEIDQRVHQCKVAFVNVLNAENKLSNTLAADILGELEM